MITEVTRVYRVRLRGGPPPAARPPGTAKTALGIYGRVWPDRDESTRAAVDAVITAQAEQGRDRRQADPWRRRSQPV
jgi:hypothetical protein